MVLGILETCSRQPEQFNYLDSFYVFMSILRFFKYIFLTIMNFNQL